MVRHSFVSAVPDDLVAGEISPDDWNDDHVVYTLPTVRGVGSSASGTGDVTPGLPTGTAEFDILLLVVQTSNQAVTAPAGYTQMTPHVGLGTAGAAGAIGGVVFWKRAGSSESAPTVTDTGDHTLAQIMGLENCARTGNPFLNLGTRRKATATTTGTAPAGATPVDNCLVVNAFFHGLDSASAVFSSFTNADLGSVTEQIDVATADGTGGGIGVCTGSMVTAGSFNSTTVTETSTSDLALTLVMLPLGLMHRHGFIDLQVFTRAGTDTWVKPTGGRIVEIVGIGGGASGSAGRNAATASGGGGGGGGQFRREIYDIASMGTSLSTATVTVGAGGAATANSDGAASNAGNQCTFNANGASWLFTNGGSAAGSAASGSGGTGGNGGGFITILTAAGSNAVGLAIAIGGAGATTAGAGGRASGDNGGGGAGGGTTQATSAGGGGDYGPGGGGGGRSNTNVGTGGFGFSGNFTGGASAGAAGTDSNVPTQGGAGGAGGTSAAGPGGQGGWPGGGGGGGGSQSGAQRGGAGGDGVVVVITYC